MGDIQDILKRRLMRFVLANRNLVNSSPKTLQHEMPIGMYYKVRTCAHIYIRRGLRCCCLGEKAIPEPLLAEQQDCSPAFNFVLDFEKYPVIKISGCGKDSAEDAQE